ncbi:DCC1-like thiol-disulfide oxidoreductase family protein [Alcanivorax sp. S71-1-4]|uniref:DCC1-like thiol-disulfide oxidoreductase family protein n=1 Tax=Alcanivorax sp. S71-1-4 TaxID=1177159 RepID=UPI0019162185|nr:DCC1-like thiol-disulfide oxidoreductase family protein [Alcanivorax sp. S71-1-4]
MQTIYLVYDTECPACDQYCRLVRIRESAGELVLVDARAPGPLMDEITAAGLDIDQGMVLKLDHQLYYGADAIHMLALLGSPSGLFNRFNRRLFGSRHLSRVLYPLLRACRNLLLKILRKTRINNLDLKERERF